MRLYLCFVVILFASAAFAKTDCPPDLPTLAQAQAYMTANVPKNSGYLWRVERDARVSWLYGTVHYNQMEYAVPGQRVMQAARQSDVLALELIPGQIQPLDNTTSAAAPSFVPTASQTSRLTALLQAACMEPVAGDAVFSAAVLTTLSALDNQRSKLAFGYSADGRLAQFSSRSGKPVIALETLQIQLNAINGPDSTPAQRSQEFDAFLTGLETGSSRKENEELVSMWQRNDLEKLVEFEAGFTQKNPGLAKRLNDDRNTAMAEKIVALHEGGKRVFVAVGSLHMVGGNSLPKLMEKAGFKVIYVPLAQK